MKKLVVYSILFMFMLSFAFVSAVQGGNSNVMSAENAGQGQSVKAGNYITNQGENMQVQTGDNNRIQLRIRNVSADCDCEMIQEQEQNRTKFKMKLSNGRNAEIKVMPDTASETALARLRLKICSEANNCTIILKETGQGNETKPAYEVQAQKQVRVLGLFRARMQVLGEVDAETGEMLKIQKPWWSFIASDEEVESSE